jgi:hypothetical protein
MPSVAIVEYQRVIAQGLQSIYCGVPVETEWATVFGNSIYSPRIDAAVGPFATEPGIRFIEEYNALMETSQGFVRRLIRYHALNIGLIDDQTPDDVVQQNVQEAFHRLIRINQNARCFLAIEIENQGSRKHLMGGAINAAALGRIGIAVAWTDEMLTAFIRLRKYFDYLSDVKSHTIYAPNLLILNKSQFQQALEE